MKKTLQEISLSKGEYGGGFSAVDYFENAPRYIRITDITENGKLKDKIKAPSGNPEEWEKYTLQEGDLLFARSGATVGKTFLYQKSHGKSIYAGYLIRFQIKKEIAFPKYIYYYTKTPEYYAWIKNKQKVVAQPNINAKQYGTELKIPLPPLPEQKRIAAILDEADKLRQLDKQLLEKYDKLAQSLFLDMFGDPVVNPKGWEKKATINYCSCIVPGRDKPKSFTGKTPWVTTNDLNHLGYVSHSKSNIGLTNEEITQVKAKIIPINSVIMTCVGDLGVISVNKKEMVVNQQLHTFQCSKEINPLFLMFSISYQKPYMYKMASTTTVAYMNKTTANNTPTILPPIELQNQFAKRIAAIEAQKAQVQTTLANSNNLFDSLLQKAFKGAL